MIKMIFPGLDGHNMIEKAVQEAEVQTGDILKPWIFF